MAEGYGGGICVFGKEDYTMEISSYSWGFTNVTAAKGVSILWLLFFKDSKFQKGAIYFRGPGNLVASHIGWDSRI